MTVTRVLHARRISIPAILLIALISTVLAVTASGAGAARETPMHHHAVPAQAPTARALRFHDGMRKLWEDHVTWTRLAIVSFAGGLPDLPATEARLLRNQADLGNAVKPFYGRAAGNRLTSLLRAHILGAVAILQAAKSGDQAQLTNATAAWYVNANQIADFLHRANPRNWPRAELRAMMKTHLDQTLTEAQDQLQGRFAPSVRDYDAVHRHILEMADTLSAGIVAQFPRRFR
jgi:hypothetical protein